MDIVAIAEMTPGSLGLNCATFVGLRTAGIGGSLSASLGVMMPSLTLCMLAAKFILQFKENRYLESALGGIRPVCLGMILSVGLVMIQSTLVLSGAPQWNLVLITILTALTMFKLGLSVPKTILLAAVLGLLLG